MLLTVAITAYVVVVVFGLALLRNAALADRDLERARRELRAARHRAARREARRRVGAAQGVPGGGDDGFTYSAELGRRR